MPRYPRPAAGSLPAAALRPAAGSITSTSPSCRNSNASPPGSFAPLSCNAHGNGGRAARRRPAPRSSAPRSGRSSRPSRAAPTAPARCALRRGGDRQAQCPFEGLHDGLVASHAPDDPHRRGKLAALHQGVGEGPGQPFAQAGADRLQVVAFLHGVHDVGLGEHGAAGGDPRSAAAVLPRAAVQLLHRKPQALRLLLDEGTGPRSARRVHGVLAVASAWRRTGSGRRIPRPRRTRCGSPEEGSARPRSRPGPGPGSRGPPPAGSRSPRPSGNPAAPAPPAAPAGPRPPRPCAPDTGRRPPPARPGAPPPGTGSRCPAPADARDARRFQAVSGAKPRRRLFSAIVRANHEGQQVVGSTGLGAQPGELEAAEGVPSHHGAGHAPVQVQVAHAEPLLRLGQVVRAAAEHAAGQGVGAVVGRSPGPGRSS